MPVLQRTDLFLSMARSLRSWQLLAFLLAVGNLVTVGAFVRLAFTTRLDSPEALERNPLGLLVTDFNWTETTLSGTPIAEATPAPASTTNP